MSSHVIEEIIRITKGKKGSYFTGMAIYEAGEFEAIQPVYNALSVMHKGENPPLIRRLPDNGGKYEYAYNDNFKPDQVKPRGARDEWKPPAQTPATAATPIKTGDKVTGNTELSGSTVASVSIPKFTGEQKTPPPKQPDLHALRTRFEVEKQKLELRLIEINKAIAAIDVVQQVMAE